MTTASEQIQALIPTVVAVGVLKESLPEPKKKKMSDVRMMELRI